MLAGSREPLVLVGVEETMALLKEKERAGEVLAFRNKGFFSRKRYDQLKKTLPVLLQDILSRDPMKRNVKAEELRRQLSPQLGEEPFQRVLSDLCRDGKLVKIDLVDRKVLGYLRLKKSRMPQDIRISPDGKLFYVADMKADGLFVVDGDAFKEVGFVPTGIGAHGLYPSRDGRKLYVANRGSNKIHAPPKGPGGVSVLDFATRKIVAEWPIPGGGSPDMGNVSADGKQLWLSGRYDDAVYVIDTDTGAVRKIKVGAEPHGLTVWPQPGRYSLGHTGNMR